MPLYFELLQFSKITMVIVLKFLTLITWEAAPENLSSGFLEGDSNQPAQL